MLNKYKDPKLQLDGFNRASNRSVMFCLIRSTPHFRGTAGQGVRL